MPTGTKRFGEVSLQINVNQYLRDLNTAIHTPPTRFGEPTPKIPQRQAFAFEPPNPYLTGTGITAQNACQYIPVGDLFPLLNLQDPELVFKLDDLALCPGFVRPDSMGNCPELDEEIELRGIWVARVTREEVTWVAYSLPPSASALFDRESWNKLNRVNALNEALEDVEFQTYAYPANLVPGEFIENPIITEIPQLYVCHLKMTFERTPNTGSDRQQRIFNIRNTSIDYYTGLSNDFRFSGRLFGDRLRLESTDTPNVDLQGRVVEFELSYIPRPINLDNVFDNIPSTYWIREVEERDIVSLDIQIDYDFQDIIECRSQFFVTWNLQLESSGVTDISYAPADFDKFQNLVRDNWIQQNQFDERLGYRLRTVEQTTHPPWTIIPPAGGLSYTVPNPTGGEERVAFSYRFYLSVRATPVGGTDVFNLTADGDYRYRFFHRVVVFNSYFHGVPMRYEGHVVDHEAFETIIRPNIEKDTSSRTICPVPYNFTRTYDINALWVARVENDEVTWVEHSIPRGINRLLSSRGFSTINDLRFFEDRLNSTLLSDYRLTAEEGRPQLYVIHMNQTVILKDLLQRPEIDPAITTPQLHDVKTGTSRPTIDIYRGPSSVLLPKNDPDDPDEEDMYSLEWSRVHSLYGGKKIETVYDTLASLNDSEIRQFEEDDEMNEFEAPSVSVGEDGYTVTFAQSMGAIATTTSPRMFTEEEIQEFLPEEDTNT